jgi:hypothetical protein
MLSPVAVDAHPCCEAVELSTPAEQAMAPRWNARSGTNPEGGAAASATKLTWFETTTKATARWALGRDLRSDKT